jgi:hypothetical protein
MVTSMCLDCARVKLEADTANIHSEMASHAGEPLANPQSEAEEAAGSERAPSVEEGELLSRSRKRRIQPSTAKGADGKKKTPACANCKKSKIRCTHRQVIEDDDSKFPSLPISLDRDELTASRQRPLPETEEGSRGTRRRQG